MGKFTLSIVLSVTICLTLVAGQQPGHPQALQPPPQQQARQAPPPPPPANQQQRRTILKPGDFVPEYDPLAPAYLQKPHLAFAKPQFAPSSHLLKPGIQYGASYAPAKPEILFKPELLLKHEIFQKPEFKQILLAKPELLKPEFTHHLLALMQQFWHQKLALLKPPPQPTYQLPYQPIPLNKYNQFLPLKPGLLEAELLKHKQFPELLKPELNFLTPIQKPEILAPSLPPQFAPNPQLESPPLNQVPQLFVPIPAVQQPPQVQPQPLPAQPAQPALLPGFEFLNQLPGFANLPGLATLPGFNLPSLPGFNVPAAPAAQPPVLTNSLQPPATLQPSPTLQPLQPGVAPVQPGVLPVQPGVLPVQPNPAVATSGALVEEQKRANLVVNENELSPEAAIGACLATPREPLSCGTQESDWDEVYEQHISCPTAAPRVWKCHCGFYKVQPGAKPVTSVNPLSPGALIPGPAPPGQMTPAGHSAGKAPGSGSRASA